MINPILLIFVVAVLHEGMDKLGIIVALATFVSYALRLLSGYISDRYKSVAALKAFERLGKGLRSASKDLMISEYSKANASGKTFGFHKTMDIAGELSGILWFFGQSETVIRTVFYATLLPGIIGLVIVAFFVRDTPKPKSFSKETFILTKKDKKSIGLLLLYFLFLFFMFSDAFFTMQAKNMGISIAIIPLLFAVSAGIQTLTSYSFGLLIDRFGARHMLLFVYACGVIAQGLLYLQEPLYIWIAYAFFGIFYRSLS